MGLDWTTQLFSTELQTLGGQNWIDGEVVDAFLSMQENKWNKATFIPSQLTACFLGNYASNSKNAVNLIKKISSIDGKIFLPYCYNEHWSVFYINNEYQTLMNINPYGDLHKPWRSSRVHKLMKKIAKEINWFEFSQYTQLFSTEVYFK